MKTATAKRSHKILNKVEFDPDTGETRLRDDHDHETVELKIGDEEMEHIKVEYEEMHSVMDPSVRMPFCCFVQSHVSKNHRGHYRRHLQKSNNTPKGQA